MVVKFLLNASFFIAICGVEAQAARTVLASKLDA
jgi:hypothetical protein